MNQISMGIIGMGKMGEAIAHGLANSTQRKGSRDFSIMGSTKTPESARLASKRLGIKVATDNRVIVEGAKVLLLCVKPHQAKTVLQEVSDLLRSDQLIISIVASLSTQQISEWSGSRAPVIRAMPNTPCLIGEGMTVLTAGGGVKPAQIVVAEKIFGPLGRTAVVEESLMDGVTGLSGCGPAYVYLIIEALSEAGVKVGLPRNTATLLAAQTLSGAAKMVLQRGEHPAALKDEVTTPGGCTIDGLMALEEGKLRATLIRAVLAATGRSKTLQK